MRFLLFMVLLLFVSPASATEIDFAVKLIDLDGKVYRDCAKVNVDRVNCDEWTTHTLGLLAYSALDRPEQGMSIIEQARRAALARKVYPGSTDKHIVDVSASEITLIVDQLGKLQIRPVELVRCIELLDPARLKEK